MKARNKYPVYIVSKGRYENPLTAKLFLKEGIVFKIVVEPQEYDLYCRAVGETNVLKLPFSNLGLGSFPARNYCWEHSIECGYKKHWCFDDNIRHFIRLNKGHRVRVNGLIALIAAEDFTDRYLNVGISAFNYRYFVTKTTKSPFRINVHAYSAMLIKNNMPFRWRLKYNEDVDLCLQVLNNKYCTILFNAFLIEKTSTHAKMKGGNQSELYKGNAYEKKVLKARTLEEIWPEYVETKIRFNRPHHFVDWRKHFKHPLIKDPNCDFTTMKKVNNYGLILHSDKKKKTLNNDELTTSK